MCNVGEEVESSVHVALRLNSKNFGTSTMDKGRSQFHLNSAFTSVQLFHPRFRNGMDLKSL
eukprot:6165836-Amphidinium_carterae.2